MIDWKKELQERDQRIEELLEVVRQQSAEIERLQRRVEELEGVLKLRAEANQSKRPSFPLNYSLEREEQKRAGGQKKISPGRRPNDQKQAQVGRTEDCYPEGTPAERCCFVRERLVWRLEEGRAVFVRYRLHRENWTNRTALLPDVLPRSEYGLEIAVTLAYLVYSLRMSIDQACELLMFFCQLSLSRSQANLILNHLGRLWQPEFETLVELLAMATVVYLDETGWRVSARRCYAWVFTSLMHTVLLYGRTREASVLDEILPRDVFRGVGVSDDYSAYRQRFTASQKCWAHLLRKAIKLMLAHPETVLYREFFEKLLELYRQAKRDQHAEQLSAEDRVRKVAELEEGLRGLLLQFRPDSAGSLPDGDDFSRLLNELVRCLAEDALFTFVRLPDVQPTNNVSERELRGSAEARKTNRTSKTDAGAQRRSVLSSVLTSLRNQLQNFTLAAVVEEVTEWARNGISRFQEQLQELQAAQPPPT